MDGGEFGGDTDDDDADLSAYDVGAEEQEEPAATPIAAPSSTHGRWPLRGERVQAVYSRRWQPATVVGGDEESRELLVRALGLNSAAPLGCGLCRRLERARVQTTSFGSHARRCASWATRT